MTSSFTSSSSVDSGVVFSHPENKSSSLTSVSANGFQILFIKMVQKKVNNGSREIVFYPDSYDGGKPSVEKFYLKPVIVCAPSKTYAGLQLKCDECDGDLKDTGWAPNYRYVHNLSSGMFFHSEEVPLFQMC